MNSEEKTIGNLVNTRFIKMGNKVLKSKVDTGAELSSMHVDTFKIEDSMVILTCKLLSDGVFKLPLHRVVTIRNSDGGTEERPVVILDISIDDGQRISADFSLNDRSDNEFPVLIGQNILKMYNFVIDPNKDDKNTVSETEEIAIISIPMGMPDIASIEPVQNTIKPIECCNDDIESIRTHLLQALSMINKLDKKPEVPNIISNIAPVSIEATNV